MAKVWTAALVVIGDEILSGRTQDRNIAQLATWLNVQGIRLSEVRVVPDVEERIVAAVNALRTTHDYLFTTGGIGPTHDDITVDSIAAAFHDLNADPGSELVLRRDHRVLPANRFRGGERSGGNARERRAHRDKQNEDLQFLYS